MQNKQKINYLHVIQWILILLFGILCISLSLNNNVWTDEAFTMQLLRQNYWGIILGTATDVHPPLYYLIGKTVQLLFGTSLLVQKLATILPVLLLMLYSIRVIRRLFDEQVSLLFILMLIAFPAILEYAVQVRMYTWAMLFVTVCGVTAYDLYLEPKRSKWIIFTLSGLAAAYTHYFALLSVALIYGYLLIAFIIWRRKEVKKWFLMSVITIVAYSPWLVVWIAQLRVVSGGYNIPEITTKTVMSYFDWAFNTGTPYSKYLFGLLFLLSVGFLTMKLIKKQNKEDSIYALLLMSVPILTTTIGVIISVLMTPIFKERYTFPAMALLFLGFAIGLRHIQRIPLFFLGLFMISSMAGQYQGTYELEYLSTKVVETEAFFEENLQEGDLLVYNFTGFGFIYEYYFPDNELIYLGDMDFARDFETIWYMDTYNYLYFDDKRMESYQLNKEFVGNYGIQDDEFKLYKITKK